MATQIIDAHSLKQWLDHNEVIIVDVREDIEYESEHIPGAIHLPLGIVKKEILPPLGHKKLVVHCMLGKRGGLACEKLLNEDPQLDVYNLQGGITAWKEAGYPVEKSP